MAVAVPAPKLNSSNIRHCVQSKRAKKPDQGTVAWLWPCMHNSSIEFQMSMAETSIINCRQPYARYNGTRLCEVRIFEIRPPGCDDDLKIDD